MLFALIPILSDVRIALSACFGSFPWCIFFSPLVFLVYFFAFLFLIVLCFKTYMCLGGAGMIRSYFHTQYETLWVLMDSFHPFPSIAIVIVVRLVFTTI